MGHGTAHHLEHAEHTQHHAHDPFDSRVAMSMAIIAAVLAAATMLSHRGHTEVLSLQTQANILHTKATDQWAYYQATNIRSHMYQALHDLTGSLPIESGTESARKAARTTWEKNLDKYEGKKGADGKRQGGGSLDKLKAGAEKLEEEGKELQKHSVLLHHDINYIDYGHLGLELALVLASVAVLTKSRAMWLSGILVAAGGAALAIFGVCSVFFIHHLHI